MQGLDMIFGNISLLENELVNLSKKLEQEKTNMFNQIVEFSPNFTAIVQDGNVVFVNLMGRSLLKCHFNNDIVGEKLLRFVDSENQIETINQLSNPSPDKVRDLIQIKMCTTDGKYIYIEANVSPFSYNNKTATLMVGRDITQELLSRTKLREAEQRYQEIFDNSIESLFLLEVLGNSHFRTIDINPKFISELGISKNEYIGKDIEEIVTPSTAVKLNYLLQCCVDSRAKIEDEIELNLPSGLRSFQVKLVPVLNNEGEICRISGAAQDISERKKDKHQLEILGFVLSNAPYAVFVNEGIQQQKFTYVNDEACKSLGYSRDELLSMTVYDIDPNITAEILTQVQENAITSGTKIFETKHKTKDGHVFPVEISLSYHNINNVYYGVSQVKNLTEIKLKQEKIDETTTKLIESEQRYREIFNHSHDSICLLEVLGDSRFRFLEVNSEYEKSLGIKSENFVGKTVDEITGHAIASIVNSKYQQCVDNGLTINEIIDLDLLIGKRSYDFHLIPIRDNSGKVYRILAVNHDITDELAIKQKLETSHNLLANAEVVASMGHYYLDLENHRLSCSKGANIIFGFPVDSKIDEKIDLLEFTHPEDMNYVKEKLDFAFKNKAEFNEVYRIIDLNGQIKVIHNIGSFGNATAGSQHIFLGSMQDISNLHFLKKEVSTQEVKMRILAENSPLGIFIANGETPLYINKALLELLRVNSVEDLHTINYYDYIHPDDRASLKCIEDKLINSCSLPSESYQLTVRYVQRCGKIRVFDLRFFCCMMEGSKYLQITVIDMTDEIEKEKLLSKLASDSLYINQKNETIAEIRNELDKILQNKCYKTNDFRNIFNLLKSYGDCKNDWGLFTEHFENLHPCFITNLKLLCSTLTLNEIKHCACIRLNFDTKETARFFNVTPASIQTARVRLKKKLNLPENIDLRELILNI